MMLLGGIFSVLGSKFIGYPSAGALGCITIAFISGIGWRRKANRADIANSSDATNKNTDIVPIMACVKFFLFIFFLLLIRKKNRKTNFNNIAFA